MTEVSCRHPRRPAGRLPGASLLLAAAAVIVALLPAGPAWLQYDRQAIAAGEVWRLFTGHWTHVSGDHLFWDVTVFLVLGALCERRSRVLYLAGVAGATTVIPLGLWLALPGLHYYRGLSGLDAALFVLLAVSLLREEWQARRWAWVVGLTLACLAGLGKVGYELTTASTIFVDSRSAAMVPVPLAHGVGAAIGLVVGLMDGSRRRSGLTLPARTCVTG